MFIVKRERLPSHSYMVVRTVPDLRNSQEGLLNLPHCVPCSFSSSGQPRLCCSGFFKPPLSLSLAIFPSLASSSSSFESVLLATRPLQEMRGPQLINLQTLDEARLSTVSLEWIMPCSSRFSTAHSRYCQIQQLCILSTRSCHKILPPENSLHTFCAGGFACTGLRSCVATSLPRTSLYNVI